MRDHPSGEKLVVTRVEVIFAKPEIVGEAKEEVGIFQDDRTVRSCSTGKTWDTTIYMCGRSDLDVSDGQSERSEYLPDRHPMSTRLDPLTRADSADLLIFKTREDRGEEGRWPDRVVVCEDDDIGGCVSDTVGHL